MAGSFNKVILLGNLTRDPELRYTPQGKAVTDISLAVNDSRDRNNPKTTYVDVVIWEKSAEIVCEYMRKGSSILVEGRLHTDSWEDRDTGKRVYKLKVVAQSFQFTGSKSGGNQGGRSNNNRNADRNSRQNRQGDYQNDQTQGGYGGDFGGNPDDIPF